MDSLVKMNFRDDVVVNVVYRDGMFVRISKSLHQFLINYDVVLDDPLDDGAVESRMRECFGVSRTELRHAGKDLFSRMGIKNPDILCEVFAKSIDIVCVVGL